MTSPRIRLSILLVVIFFLHCILSNPRLRPNFPNGLPGLQGHAAVEISRGVLPSFSPFYMNESTLAEAKRQGNRTEVILIYGGYSNFIQNYTEMYSESDSMLNARVYLLDEETGKMSLFWSNETNEVMAHFEDEENIDFISEDEHPRNGPEGRAYFDYVLLDGRILWISGGIKNMFLRKEFSGIADACLWGDVWKFNITSGRWKQLVKFQSTPRFKECQFSEVFTVESSFDFIFLYSIVIALITIAFSWTMCIACSS
mmetsp:Transcript_4388/g.16552  ORF Transcript_4388/g.16552 Transcript_4388/m.16552 type:complete len:257 (-) Transcript_4388:2848-3618(-)